MWRVEPEYGQGLASAASIFRRNTIGFGLFQLVFSAALLHAILTQSRWAAVLFWMTTALAPLYVWITYCECRRAWLRQCPDELHDVSIPTITVASALTLLAAVVN